MHDFFIASQVNTQMFPAPFVEFASSTWVFSTKLFALFLGLSLCIFNRLDLSVRQMLVSCQYDLFCVTLAGLLNLFKPRQRG